MTLRRTRRLDIYIVIKELRKEHSEYSLCQLCMIGHVNRGAYYKWMNNPDSQNDALNKRIADKIMEIHGEHPDMGYRRIRDTLAHDHDINVSDKRVLRICRKKEFNQSSGTDITVVQSLPLILPTSQRMY